MRPLPDLARSWPSIELPGYREHPMGYGTYSAFAYDELPPIERELDDEEEETVRLFDSGRGPGAVCAESFSEFLFRFWIENEIWFSLADPDD